MPWHFQYALGRGQPFLPRVSIITNTNTIDDNRSVKPKLVTKALVDVWSENATAKIIMEFAKSPAMAMICDLRCGQELLPVGNIQFDCNLSTITVVTMIIKFSKITQFWPGLFTAEIQMFKSNNSSYRGCSILWLGLDLENIWLLQNVWSLVLFDNYSNIPFA